jgi:hypothetical protein
MFATCSVVGFFFALAWIQQYYLDRIIAADREYLKTLMHQPTNRSSRH